MDWIFDHSTLVFFVIVSVASLIKSVIESRKKSAQPGPAEQEMSEEEWFGPSAPWQPVVPPPSSLPPEPSAKAPPPLPGASQWSESTSTPPKLFNLKLDLSEAQSEWTPQAGEAERLRQLREKRAVTTGGAAATQKRVVGTAAAPSLPAQLPLRQSLRRCGELRRAFVTSEVLGAPLASKSTPSRL